MSIKKLFDWIMGRVELRIHLSECRAQECQRRLFYQLHTGCREERIRDSMRTRDQVFVSKRHPFSGAVWSNYNSTGRPIEIDADLKQFEKQFGDFANCSFMLHEQHRNNVYGNLFVGSIEEREAAFSEVGYRVTVTIQIKRTIDRTLLYILIVILLSGLFIRYIIQTMDYLFIADMFLILIGTIFILYNIWLIGISLGRRQLGFMMLGSFLEMTFSDNNGSAEIRKSDFGDNEIYYDA